MENTILPLLLGYVCVQFDVSTVVIFTSYSEHKYDQLVSVSGWVSSVVFSVLFLFFYDLLIIDVLVITLY